jgi:phage terminase large subunit
MNEKVVKLFKTQYEAFKSEAQFTAAVAGVQSGKTFLGAHWAGRKIIEYPKGVGIIVAPTYKVLQQATLKKFFEVLPQLRKYYKEQKGEIELPTGGTVFIRSADSPLGIEGISPQWWWLDEGGMTSELTWTVLRSRVSMTGGKGLITTTPYNVGWLYQKFYKPWKEGSDTNLAFFTWRSIDNPNFPQDFYKAEKSRLRPEEFARRYMGEFQKMTGLIWDLPSEAIIGPVEIATKAQARLIGVDWGFRNPAGIIVAYLYDQVWYVVDEWKQANRTTAELIQVIRNLITKHQVTNVYADPAEPDRIEECRRAGVPIYEANNDVITGINKVSQAIYEKRFKVFNTCPELIDEMSMYHYLEQGPTLEGKRDPKEQPEKFNDHLCDALRYPIASYAPMRIIQQQVEAPKYYYPELGY